MFQRSEGNVVVALSAANDSGDRAEVFFGLSESENSPSILDLDRDDVVIDLRDGDGSRAVLRAANSPSFQLAHGPVRRAGWRVADLIAAVAGCIIAFPVMLLVAGLVRISSPGPAVFRQERVGRGGYTFDCLKFRTMHVDSEERLSSLLESDPMARAEWLRDHKLRNDPRITPIGRLLRRTNLDELPQLLNVLRGTMSVVGPRPVVPTETVRYGEHIVRVLSVKPGITGLWQVSGRNDLEYHERVALDLAYVDTKSLFQDTSIAVRTIATMVSGRGNGAY